MAAASIPSTSGIKQTLVRSKQDDRNRPPTIEELLIQVENHIYINTEQRASLIIAVWSSLGGQISHCRNLDKIFHMLYRESAMMVFNANWQQMDMRYKRGLARALIHFSQTLGSQVKGAEGLCSALVMANYDPWGDPAIRQILVQKQNFDKSMVQEFIKSEPHKLLLIRIECLVLARFEEAAIRLLQTCLHSAKVFPSNEDADGCDSDWRWAFMEWLLRLLFRKQRLNDIVAEASSCSCHDGVRLIYRTFNSELEDSEALTETLINLFLVRDLLFKSSYCCTSELMKLWCEFQAKKRKSSSEIEEAARKLLVGHASSSAQFYLFVDILWGKFGISLLPLYLEMYIRGLTSDLNHLEAARQTENRSYVVEIENHMAAMYFKLFSLFLSLHKEVALECLLSSFSLDPTKERLEWIKKVTLQITKDRAMASMHQSCCRVGCSCMASHHAKKRMAVVMCDQAIQVGNDSFVEEDLQCCDTTLDKEKQASQVEEQGVLSMSEQVSQTQEGRETALSPVAEQNGCNSSDQVLLSNLNSDVIMPSVIDCIKSDSEPSKSLPQVVVINENSVNEIKGDNSDHLPSSLEQNHVLENCNDTESCSMVSENKVLFNCKMNHLSDGLVKAVDEVSKFSNSEIIKEECHTDNVVETDSVNISNEVANHKSNEILAIDSVESGIANAKENFPESSENHVVESQKLCEDMEVVQNEKAHLISLETPVESNDTSKTSEKDSCLVTDISNMPQVNDNKTRLNENVAPSPSSSCFEKYENLIPFSHIVLDAKLPGVSETLLCDFVTVLESMRNKQLKSSSKWSQIKHLCEGYMQMFNNARCRMNSQINGSVDSEADSTSEFDLQDFEFQESIDSVVEDKCADKTHVFKKFMNADKTTGLATYVNLSDIHCPQIPLEKLFYSDYSSSHAGGHKKKHRCHRNHETGKLMLKKKFRHGERAERELAKHRKKKKRKAKKAHVKKHRFTHGKVNKSYLKDKRKKHKQKKKEGNSGFISGDYCSDFSSGELMRLVNEHSNSYSKVQTTTSKHPHSTALVVRKDSSSEASNEPQRKKRKVSFSKKRNRDDKCREKHKHTKSKSSKHKKTILVESCNAELNEPNQLGNTDYSHIVKFSSVKKMEAVQIRQRSVALNLSKVSNRKPTKSPSKAPCDPNPQFQHIVQQNFESYSPEDIMKMQLLMARQQPDTSSISKSTPSSNNQAVLKYVSKTTSYLAQSSNCVIGSDSETSKSPVPTIVEKSPAMPRSTSNLLPKPQNVSSNVKHFILDANNSPYQLASGSSLVAGNALIPVSLAGKSYPDLQTLSRNPATLGTSHVQAFRIPVGATQNQMSNPIVIPLPAGHLSSVSGMSLIPRDSLVATAGNQSNVIIVKNGNTTQIIQNVQPSVSTCIDAGGKVFTPIARGRVINPVITKTVPRIIKQAARKLSQPIIRRTIKSPLPIKPVTNTSTSSNFTSSSKPDITQCSGSNLQPETNLTPESLIVQRAIAEAKRAIAESSHNEQKRSNPIAVEKKVDKSPSPIVAKIPPENTESIKPMVSEPLVESSCVEDCAKNVTLEKDVLFKSVEKDTILEKVLLMADCKVISDDKADLTLESDKTEQTLKEVASDPLIPEAADIVTEPVNKENINETESIPVEDKIMTPSPPIKEIPEVKEKESSLTIPTETALPVAEPIVEATPSNALSAESPMDKSIAQHQVSSQDESISPIPVPPESERLGICTMSSGSVEQSKPLEPINEGSTNSMSKTLGKMICIGKTDSGTPTSEVQTRSFTSISDAVRFSLMDMDDATDSVENQVLQAFQVSQNSSPRNSPRFDNTSTNDDNSSPVPSPSSAVILTTPQNATTTELNVSQRFESAAEKFAECQSSVNWILEDDTGVVANDVTHALRAMQKSPDEVDSSGEGDDKPRKKKKRKDRMDRSPESAHKFWCEICHKGFFSAYNLRRHCRNVHKMNLPRGSSDLPFGPKSTTDSIAYAANSAQLHSQHGENSSEVVTPPRYSGSIQQSCVSPKGGEFMLQSPTRENKTHEFTIKQSSTSQHMQNSDFQMQTPPRISSQPSSLVATATQRLQTQTPTSVSNVQMSPTKVVSKPASATSPKFQRLPTSCSTTIPQINKVSQISSQMSQIQTQTGLQQQQQARQQLDQLQQQQQQQQLQPLVCQTQQLQQAAAQCSHFQANKAQIVQQRIGQLQLMQQQPHQQLAQAHAAALAGIPKQVTVQQQQSQQFKKCGTSSKISETEQQIQQQLLANQHLQKLMHIRQNAIAAPQLTLTAAASGSPPKASTQCFQSQLAAARQAAAQLPVSQQRTSVATGYPHDAAAATSHQQFFAIQPGQEQPSSCPHAFGAQNIVEFSSASSTSYPTIRLSSETNDGLEDLEQFLLENMPWSGGDQSLTHGLSQQQSGNRPSSADSLTLAIPSQSNTSAQNRAQFKIKSSISRPKPRKPMVSSSCSKNLLGNLGRGVKKKSLSPTKKTSKSPDTECVASKSDMFSAQSSIHNTQPLTLNLMQQQCTKDMASEMFGSKCATKSISVSNINETDSSDSVQCINITPTITPKSTSVGINFNTFASSDKNANPLCNVGQSNVQMMFGMQNKSAFLDQCSLVNKSCSGDKGTTSIIGVNEGNVMHSGNPFILSGKDSTSGSKPLFYRTGNATKRIESAQDVFLGQANSDKCDSSRIANDYNVQNLVSVDSSGKLSLCQDGGKITNDPNCVLSQCRKDGSASDVVQSDLFLDGKTASPSENAVSEKTDSVVSNATSVSVERSNLADCTKSNENTFQPFHLAEKYPETSTLHSTHSDNSYTLLNKNSAPSTKSVVNPCVFNKNTEVLGSSSLVSLKVQNSQESSDSASKSTALDDKVKENLDLIPTLSNKRDINFNNLAYNFSPTGMPISELKTVKADNLGDKELSDKCKLGASAEEFGKNSLPVRTDATSFSNSTGFAFSCDKEGMPKFTDGHDKVSSQENLVPNGLGYMSRETDNIENKKEPGSKRIALRIHKLQDGQNEDASYFVAGKPKSKSKSSKKSSQKSKSGHSKREVGDAVPNLVLDINSNVQKTGFNSEHKVDEYNTTSTNGSREKNLVEIRENEEMCVTPRRHISPDESSPSRLRLRETTKMSVKRTCPCCVNSHTPKKCRAVTKLFVPKVQSNNSKTKSTLKTRNTSSAKANTRSSQRLRSRNNAIS